MTIPKTIYQNLLPARPTGNTTGLPDALGPNSRLRIKSSPLWTSAIYGPSSSPEPGRQAAAGTVGRPRGRGVGGSGGRACGSEGAPRKRRRPAFTPGHLPRTQQRHSESERTRSSAPLSGAHEGAQSASAGGVSEPQQSCARRGRHAPGADLPPQRAFQHLLRLHVVIFGQDQDHLWRQQREAEVSGVRGPRRGAL